MRVWVYDWKSPDGLRHEGEMSAPDKDSVYAELRARGIRAIRVTERVAPVVRRGFHGLRKRDWLLIALGALCLASCAVALTLTRRGGILPPPDPASRRAPASGAPVDAPPSPRQDKTRPSAPVAVGDRVATARSRHQFALPAEPATNIFRHVSEAYLARFARPGRRLDAASVRIPDGFAADLRDAIEDPIVIFSDDPKPVSELKRVVAGIKEEAALILGGGRSEEGIVEYLVERQRMECAWRESMLKQFREGAVSRDEANRQLAAMELPPLPAD